MLQNMIIPQNIEMIKDYIQQLKELQEDKAQFQSNAIKGKLRKNLIKQQDKYQAYILDQMASQNRIIAANHIALIIDAPTRRIKAQFLKNIEYCKQTQEYPCNSETTQKRSEGDCCQSQQSMSSIPVDMTLLKMCTNTIFRQVEKIKVEIIRQTFTVLNNFSKNKKLIDKLLRILGRYAIKQAFGHLKTAPHKDFVQDHLFSDSFSMIEKQSRVKKCNPDESYLSFMIEKENQNLECYKCKQAHRSSLQKDKQVLKLKQELSYLKNLLTQKNLELKMKQEQCDQLRLRSCQDQQLSSYGSKNQSYYSQMQRQVLGSRRTRKTGSIASNKSNFPKEEISKQLLGKYMKQSFQLKQTMDVAREICLQVQASIPLTHRTKLQQLLNVLNRGDQVSLVDDY